jgi:hypothetical protein
MEKVQEKEVHDLVNQKVEDVEVIVKMPVTKCANGKYRIGNGKCIYTSKKKAEKAYKAYIAKKNK